MIPALQLTEDEVHLWMVNPQEISVNKQLRLMLNPAENEKIARYRYDKAKHTALITRVFIRLVLSQYTTVTPQQWQFTISDLGKPEIKQSPLPLRFNVSHNDERIICAVGLEKDIGCDIENLSRKISISAITKRFFSSQEHQLITAQPARFFEYWTLKEAFVKATGLGISQGLDTFSFEVKSQKEATFNDNISLTFADNCKEENAKNWYHALFFPDTKHCIALSINNKKQTDKKPTIRLFSENEATLLFNH